MGIRTLATAILILTTGCEVDVIGDLGIGFMDDHDRCMFTLVGRVTKRDGGGKNGVKVQLHSLGGGWPLGDPDKTNRQGFYSVDPVGIPHEQQTLPIPVSFSKKGRVLWDTVPSAECSTDTLDVVWPWG